MVVSILAVDVVVTCCVVVFECGPLWAITGCPSSCDCSSIEPVVVVVVVGWGESCFGVTRWTVGGVFAVSSPKKNGGQDTFVTWCKDIDLVCHEALILIYLISHLLTLQSEVSPVLPQGTVWLWSQSVAS